MRLLRIPSFLVPLKKREIEIGEGGALAGVFGFSLAQTKASKWEHFFFFSFSPPVPSDYWPYSERTVTTTVLFVVVSSFPLKLGRGNCVILSNFFTFVT
jgi:hypothetical protein